MTDLSLQALAGLRSRTLEELLTSGETPDACVLTGWEYRGVNMPSALPTLLGIRRFLKGFEVADAGVIGFNKQIVGSELGAPWTVRPQRDGRQRYAYFAVKGVDVDRIDNRYGNALLLDYGAAPQPERGIAARLRTTWCASSRDPTTCCWAGPSWP